MNDTYKNRLRELMHAKDLKHYILIRDPKGSNTYKVCEGPAMDEPVAPEVKNNDYFLAYGPIRQHEKRQQAYNAHLQALYDASMPIQGNHDWKEGQELILDKDFVVQENPRCCGRCDGVNNECVADMICGIHTVQGCEICYGERIKKVAVPVEARPKAVELGCIDCGMPYKSFPLDTGLSNEQWLLINPDNTGVLCANCIVKRAATIKRAIRVDMNIVFAVPVSMPPAESDYYNQCKPENVTQEFLLHLIDIAWNECSESESVPSTIWAKKMIVKAYETFTPAVAVPVATSAERFTMKDFEKGLMLAGLVEPANEQEAAEKKTLDDFEAIPRRIRLDLNTEFELAIYNAMQAVEKQGADVRLTMAVAMLDKAKNLVSDFVDGLPAEAGGVEKAYGFNEMLNDLPYSKPNAQPAPESGEELMKQFNNVEWDSEGNPLYSYEQMLQAINLKRYNLIPK